MRLNGKSLCQPSGDFAESNPPRRAGAMKAAASRRTPNGLCLALKVGEKKKPGGREISPGFLIEAKVLTRNLLLLLLLLLL